MKGSYVAGIALLFRTSTAAPKFVSATDSVIISGQAEQAAPLLIVIASSPLCQNSEFTTSVSRGSKYDGFRIRTDRRRK